MPPIRPLRVHPAMSRACSRQVSAAASRPRPSRAAVRPGLWQTRSLGRLEQFPGMLPQVTFGFLCLGVHFVEGWDVIVPLEQRGRGSAALDRACVKLPYGVDHGMIVSVENVFLVTRMARNVNLGDALRGHGIHL